MSNAPFGLSWFWKAVIGILAVTTAVLVALLLVQQRDEHAVAAANAAKYTPPSVVALTPQQRVVYLGDSYSQGAGSTDHTHRWTTVLARDEEWLETNDARGGTGYFSSLKDGEIACGEPTCPSYADMISTAVSADPDVVVVSGGRNDVPYSTNEVNSAIESFFTRLRKAFPNTKIYVTSPLWGAGTPPTRLSEIAAEVKSNAGRVHATYLDIGQPLYGHVSWLISDGVHPNDTGHAAIAQAVAKAISTRA